MTHLFTWGGVYFGFISGGNIFNGHGKYVGWIEDGRTAWLANGKYMGEIVEKNHILRNQLQMEPMPRMPHMPPMSPMPPMAPMNQMAKIPKTGYVDALA